MLSNSLANDSTLFGTMVYYAVNRKWSIVNIDVNLYFTSNAKFQFNESTIDKCWLEHRRGILYKETDRYDKLYLNSYLFRNRYRKTS